MILAEVLCDCSSSQAVVKELRVSASPLEQRKFLAESEPYRWVKMGVEATQIYLYRTAQQQWDLKCFAENRKVVRCDMEAT